MLERISPYRKALVVPTVGIILFGLSHLGITPQMSVEEAITVLVSFVAASAGVYQIANKR